MEGASAFHYCPAFPGGPAFGFSGSELRKYCHRCHRCRGGSPGWLFYRLADALYRCAIGGFFQAATRSEATQQRPQRHSAIRGCQTIIIAVELALDRRIKTVNSLAETKAAHAGAADDRSSLIEQFRARRRRRTLSQRPSVVSEYALEAMSSLQEVTGTLADHNTRCHRVAGRHAWQHRAVRDPHVLETVDSQLVIDHGH